MKKTLIFALILVAIAVSVLAVRFLSGAEDTWICVNGVWQKHGNPSGPFPSAPCEVIPLGNPDDGSAGSPQDGSVGSPQDGSAGSPQALVETFLNWYTDASSKDVSSRTEIADTLKARIERSAGGETDPVICADETPLSFTIGKAAIEGDTATVPIEQTFTTGKRILPVLLERTGGVWHITDIPCSQAIPQAGLPGGDPTEGTVPVSFAPMQCEETPWDAWYKTGAVQFFKAPTEVELITTYYAMEYSIELQKVMRIQSDMMVCQACGVCPTGYTFTATVRASDASRLKDLGWR